MVHVCGHVVLHCVVFLAQPTAASRDLFSAAFAGQLVLHLDLRATPPIRLLQLGVVPAGACLYEGGWSCGCGLCVCVCVCDAYLSFRLP